MASVGRHFVTLSCVRRCGTTDSEPTVLVFSGFLIEVSDVWFWVTAGHIFRDIRSEISKGRVFDTWRLDDQTARNNFKGAAIPFVFEPEQWIVVEDEPTGLDYAAVSLHPVFCRQLEAGNAAPISRNAWGDHVTESDQWALVGIPSESVSWDQRSEIVGKVTLLPIEPTGTPESAGEKASNQFFARITAMGTVSDIDGMSGGPLFSLKKVDSEWRYSVIGIQSGWYPSIKTIAACPFVSFASALEPLVESALTRPH